MPPSVFPTGVTISDPDIAHPTSILIDTRKGHSYVIGMDGSVIHSWPKIGFPSELIDPALWGSGVPRLKHNLAFYVRFCG